VAWYKVTGPDYGQPSIRKVRAGSKQLCLVSDGLNVYALASQCPHAGAELSGGWCQDGKLVCPFHRYSYDLSTGRGSAGQNDFVQTYLTEKRPDGIYVQVQSLLERIKDRLS